MDEGPQVESDNVGGCGTVHRVPEEAPGVEERLGGYAGVGRRVQPLHHRSYWPMRTLPLDGQEEQRVLLHPARRRQHRRHPRQHHPRSRQHRRQGDQGRGHPSWVHQARWLRCGDLQSPRLVLPRPPSHHPNPEVRLHPPLVGPVPHPPCAVWGEQIPIGSPNSSIDEHQRDVDVSPGGVGDRDGRVWCDAGRATAAGPLP